MRMKLLFAMVFTIGLTGTASAADDTKAPEAPKEKKICRTETVTGSLVAKRRICMTKAEWDKLAQDTKIELDKYTSRQNGLAIPPTN